MPKFDIVGTVLELLFEDVPRRTGFLIFGEDRIPAATAAAAQVVLASIGLAAGSSWPERATALVRAQPGFSVEDVIGNLARRLEAEMASAQSISPALRIWAIAYVEDSMISTNVWHPFKAFHASGPYAYASGVAAGMVRDDSDTLIESWLNGIGNAWASALEAELAIDGPAPSFESLLASVDDLLTLLEQERSVTKPPESWRTLEQLWRFEVYRIGLLAIGAVGWREPEAPKYRGILY